MVIVVNTGNIDADHHVMDADVQSVCMMRNSITQRRHEPRDRVAVANARDVPACSRGATYRVELTLVP